MRRKFGRAIGVVALTLLGPLLAQASEFHLSINGHDVAVEEREDGQELLVDGQVLHSDYYVFIDSVEAVDGQTVLVGTSSAGGNACEGAPFILFLDKDGKPRLHGPVDTCLPTTVTTGQGGLTITETPIPGQDAQQWNWTPEAGLVAAASVPFTPDKKGWAELRNDGAGHPADLLSYAQIAAEVDRLLGSDKAQFLKFVIGLGSSEQEGDLISGSACIKYDCPENAALMVADLQGQALYLAWKPAGEKILVRPVVSQWPDAARARLRQWAEPWN